MATARRFATPQKFGHCKPEDLAALPELLTPELLQLLNSFPNVVQTLFAVPATR